MKWIPGFLLGIITPATALAQTANSPGEKHVILYATYEDYLNQTGDTLIREYLEGGMLFNTAFYKTHEGRQKLDVGKLRGWALQDGDGLYRLFPKSKVDKKTTYAGNETGCQLYKIQYLGPYFVTYGGLEIQRTMDESGSDETSVLSDYDPEDLDPNHVRGKVSAKLSGDLAGYISLGANGTIYYCNWKGLATLLKEDEALYNHFMKKPPFFMNTSPDSREELALYVGYILKFEDRREAESNPDGR